jgi:hypothetical protein
MVAVTAVAHGLAVEVLRHPAVGLDGAEDEFVRVVLPERPGFDADDALNVYQAPLTGNRDRPVQLRIDPRKLFVRESRRGSPRIADTAGKE